MNERKCIDCGADISARHYHAKLCLDCYDKRGAYRKPSPDLTISNLSRQLAATEARAQLAERLLHDLTPTGSEFVGRPQKCFEWVRDHISDLMRIAVDATAKHRTEYEETQRLKRKLAAAEVREKVLQVIVQRANELIDNPPDIDKYNSREWALCDIGRYDALVDAVETLANTDQKEEVKA